MADLNGKAAGIKFLKENKKKEGVVVLPSGLQYKVLNEGPGTVCPTVRSPCECHYAGRLLDGTEFDSSYRRGKPTTFAPNQVIKGWTEAMQLMAEGDKWEMYIPMELAYGPEGRPPKIPPAAMLIFQMEIIKIKGESKAKNITFPEWTPEQLPLWGEKDEESCQKWRETRVKAWEDGDQKLKDQHPERAGFDTWLDKQCKLARDKSLWKRTRTRPEPVAMPERLALTAETARALLTKAFDVFALPDNRKTLEDIAKECEGKDEKQLSLVRMMKLMPALQKMIGPALEEHGFREGDPNSSLMTVAAEIQRFGVEDASIAADVMKLLNAFKGDVAKLFEDKD